MDLQTKIGTLLLTAGHATLTANNYDIWWGEWPRSSGSNRRTLASAPWPLGGHEIHTHWLNLCELVKIKKKAPKEEGTGEGRRERERSGQNVSGYSWRSGQIPFRDKRIVVAVLCECGSPVTSQRHEDFCHWVVPIMLEGSTRGWNGGRLIRPLCVNDKAPWRGIN